MAVDVFRSRSVIAEDAQRLELGIIHEIWAVTKHFHRHIYVIFFNGKCILVVEGEPSVMIFSYQTDEVLI